ncbi:Protein STRUBBELIG-RECEPTOR FAMILY 3 [Forsythia ovata]|uniref:Protein STRUBBELIG-RECEPTOR FAMILY 3 n=1 Tax=Forsythia ovata TaxID=205694 RepID=A0ABD1R489_9LAMI
MGGSRSVENCLNLKILVGFILVFAIRFSHGDTNPNDVAALNSLYVSLESPSLPGWVASGGDPCGEAWQGIQCDGGTTISSITLNGANLGGELGDSLGTFSSIKSIELSNNLIGGSIPSELPATLQNFFLSDNKFTGSIPSSLSSLSQLSALSLNNNQLTGEIPDSFEGLTALVNLDFSSNSLSGQLPPSLRNLSSLTTLHLQNNQLSGALDVLQDLPLRDLNIENNQFSGPIPAKLLSIPNFRKDGNSFNSSIAPLPPPAGTGTPPPAPPFFLGPTSQQTPPTSGRRHGKQGDPGRPSEGPSATKESNSVKSKKSSRIKRIVWISIAAVLLFIILVLAILLFVPKCLEKRRETYRTPKRHEIAPFTSTRENPRDGGSMVQPSHDKEKAPSVAVVRPNAENEQRAVGSIPKPWNEREPIAEAEATVAKSSTRQIPATSVKAYTIASLQQYTNSFSQENLIGGGMLGNVYKAQLPDGRLLAVKKLDKRVSNQQKDDQFLELVNSLDKIRHANVVELMGYCVEHGQRLLIYEYCSNGTLQDALHSDDEFKKKLSWNTRIRMALGAARALE